MFCENCGYPAKPTDRFCQHCGAQLMNGGSGYEKYEIPVAEYQQAAVQDTTVLQKGNSEKTILAFVAVVIFVIFAAAIHKTRNSKYTDETKIVDEFVKESKVFKSDEEKKLDDIKHGAMLATAINAALGNEEAWDAMQDNPYSGQVMPIEDITLLPDVFVAEVRAGMPEMPEIEYTKNGATGYAFLLSIEPGESTLKVYISSKDKLDEWEVSPSICDEYSGNTTE